MKAWHIPILVMLSVPCFSQTQGNLPGPADANTGFSSNSGCSHTANCVNIPDSVANGDEIVGCLMWGSTGSAPVVTDNLGNSFTQETPLTIGTTGNDQPFHLQMYHAHSSSSGADWIILTGGSDLYTKPVSRFTGVSDTKDGSLATVTGTPGANAGSISQNVTSAVNGDIAISCIGNGGNDASLTNVGNNGMVASDNHGADTDIGYQNLGLLGTYSITATIVNGNGTEPIGLATALFKPSTTIFLSDTALPQAADGVAYSAQLHVVGGISGTLTYACTGLPSNGLSLNTSTGVISGATPSGIATVSLGCTVSDGTNTSASDSLSIKVGAAFGVVSLGGFVTGTFANGGGALTGLPVTCGDVVVLCATQGDDTHGAVGWIQALNGSLGNKYSDSLGSTVQRMPVFGGTPNGPTSCVLFGPVATNASDVITAVNNQSATSGLNAWAIDIKNAQGILDVGSYANATTTTSSPTASTSFTTPVANEEAITAATIACATAGCGVNGTPGTNVTFGGAYSLSSQNGPNPTYALSGFGTASIAAAGSTTATATFNNATPTNGMNTSIMLMALRPALPAACTAPTLGEKIRRYVN